MCFLRGIPRLTRDLFLEMKARACAAGFTGARCRDFTELYPVKPLSTGEKKLGIKDVLEEYDLNGINNPDIPP